MKEMKFVLVLLLGLLSSAAASPAASVEQLKGWLAANGMDPDDFGKLRVFVDSKGELKSWSWDEDKLGVAVPAEDELPSPSAARKARETFRAESGAKAEAARQLSK